RGAEVHSGLEQLLGRVVQAGADLREPLAGFEPLSPREGGWGEGRQTDDAPDGAASEDPASFYRNTFTAIPASLPYRPKTLDGHGLLLHPKPTVHGTQSAIVVSDGAPVPSDRDHRTNVDPQSVG